MQKIVVLEAKLGNMTKDLYQMTKFKESVVVSNVGKDNLTNQVCKI